MLPERSTSGQEQAMSALLIHRPISTRITADRNIFIKYTSEGPHFFRNPHTMKQISLRINGHTFIPGIRHTAIDLKTIWLFFFLLKTFLFQITVQLFFLQKQTGHTGEAYRICSLSRGRIYFFSPSFPASWEGF